MVLHSELSELLSGFEKRMKFINIVRCLLDYKYPDHVRSMIPDKKILDNIVVAVLVYINDRTLSEEQTCTLSDIEGFLDDLSVILPSEYVIETKSLARYLIVDVLQNGGIMTEFLTFYSTSQQFEPMSIRLINEERGSYHLTDDAFDFLFRSKEIESQLDYSIARFRMEENFKRHNYIGALEDSRELVVRIRNVKAGMDDFLRRCRENISLVTIDEYETIIGRKRSLLDDEYEKITRFQATVREQAKLLGSAHENGVGTETIQKHRMALAEIIENISLTINEQRVLINKEHSLSESYQALIRDQFAISRFERLHFEKDILIPLRKLGDGLGDAAKFLLFMLTKPEFEKVFSVENFYGIQGNLRESEKEEGFDITAEETDIEKQIEIRNERFREICLAFFRFANTKERFLISEMIESLSLSKLKEYCEENALPDVLLTLFSMQTLDMEGWRKQERFTVIPNGEFELSWCLEEIPGEYLQMKQICFSDHGGEYRISLLQDGWKQHIDMTDFEVEVIR